MREEAVNALRELNEVIERLRAPGGCPWDREQTHESLRPYLLEETYEVLEAIDGGGDATLSEELGDVLLQVLMHCAIAAEREGGFDIGDVAETTRKKMIHRHPHVFADIAVEGPGEVVVNWERLKRAEKSGRISLLDGVPRALPALALALGVQRRPARLGFDETPTILAAAGGLQAALDELVAAAAAMPETVRGEDWSVTEGELRREPSAVPSGQMAPGQPTPAGRTEAAVGELLFAAVALSRQLRVNPEDALRTRANRFGERFRSLEASARADGVDLHDIDRGEWERRWEHLASPS